MSITFFFDGDDTVIDLMTCQDCEDAVPTWVCPICRGSKVEHRTYDAHQVNMANGNAFELARVLEIPDFDHCGEIAAQTLLDLTTDVTWAFRVPFGGDRAYFIARVGQLQKLAMRAIEKGADLIGWG